MKPILCYPCNLPFQISQKFGENHEYYFNNFKQKGHNGWDFSIAIGTPLYATHDGTISFCAVTDFGDLAISIMDVSGTFRTIYGHLSESKVKLGDIVKKGQLVALSGNTGRYTTGPHLHFGIHEVLNGNDINNDNGFSGGVDPAKGWDGTYPKDYNKSQSIDSTFTKMMMAVKDFQISQGIMDFKNETDPKKIIIGPKTLNAIKKYK